MVPPQPAAAGAGRAALPARIALIALADAAAAGALAGIVDLGVVLTRTPPAAAALPATALVVVGLTILGVALTGAPLVLLVRLLGRHPQVRSFAGRLAAPGPTRVAALVELVAVLAVLAGLWGLGFAVSRFAHGAYNSSTGIALMTATALLGGQVVAVLIASAIAPPLARWLAARPAARRATSGWPMAAAFGAVAVAALLAGDRVLRARFHSWDPVPAYVYGVAATAIVVAAVIRPSERLGRRGVALAAALAAIALAAVAALSAAPAARAAVMASGVTSEGALRSLLRLADRDGDGHAGTLGGGDCDDGDAAVHPAARERAGNRRDDNCIGGDGGAGAPAAPAEPGALAGNVLLVTIDSVRADHTSAYGYPRPTTPVLAALAARGARFERAETASPTTRRALPALLFGRYPSTLPFDPSTRMPRLLPHALPTLASALGAAGYRSHAVFSVGGLLDDQALVGFAGTESLTTYGRGYQRPDNAVAVTDRALAWIGSPAPRPWFLWVHYFDPHHPYATPPGAPDFGDEPMDHHDAEIAHVDAQIGRLLAGLDATTPTVVVVTSDHGEAFGERGVHFHGKNLHEEQTRVPLVISVVGAPAMPRVEATPVSLVDVAPTVLDLVGAALPDGMNGRSLAPVVLGVGSAPARPLVMELVPDRFVDRRMVAIVDGDHKLIWDLDAGAMAAFDLRRDPGEDDDLIATPLGAVLRATLGATLDDELGADRR
jgi:arylsulfatase A-like enzyme